MEEELDEVEEGKLDWRKAVSEFDTRFRKDRDLAPVSYTHLTLPTSDLV